MKSKNKTLLLSIVTLSSLPIMSLVGCTNSINKSNTITNTSIFTNNQHPVQPIDNQWFGAEISCKEKATHYATISEAFEVLNSPEYLNNPKVTMTLFEDWIADENGNFTISSGGVIKPESRACDFFSVTIDLNGFTVDGNRKGKAAINHGIFQLRSAGLFTVKNGTITGAKSNCSGGAILFDCDDNHTILQNLTIIDNEVTHGNGAAIFSKNCSGALDIDNCIIQHNTADDGYGGGLYWEMKFLNWYSTITLNNTVVINQNSGKNGRNNFVFEATWGQSPSLYVNNVNLNLETSSIGICPSDYKFNATYFKPVLEDDGEYPQKLYDLDNYNCFACDDRAWGIHVCDKHSTGYVSSWLDPYKK